MCLTASRKPDEFTPCDFMYILPDDTDKDIPVTLTFHNGTDAMFIDRIQRRNIAPYAEYP